MNLNKEDADKLRELIDQLPRGQRDVVMMRIFQRMRYAEIAAHLGISAGAARERFRKAKKEIRKVTR